MFSGTPPQTCSLKAEENIKPRGEVGSSTHSKACLLSPWGAGRWALGPPAGGEQIRKPDTLHSLPTKPRADQKGRESWVHARPPMQFPSEGWDGCRPPSVVLLSGIASAKCGPGNESRADPTRGHIRAGHAGDPQARQGSNSGLGWSDCRTPPGALGGSLWSSCQQVPCQQPTKPHTLWYI